MALGTRAAARLCLFLRCQDLLLVAAVRLRYTEIDNLICAGVRRHHHHRGPERDDQGKNQDNSFIDIKPYPTKPI